MPCRSPRRQYYRDGQWSFNPRPILGVSAHRDLACRMCRDCRIRKSREWSIRAYHEAQLHPRNCWITITYATDPVTLSRRHIQLFLKALRNAGLRFRYFGAGEYGDKRSRPHYHICFFGIDFHQDRYPWTNRNGRIYYRSPTLEKAWPHGYSEICDFAPEAALYCAGYTAKKINGKAMNLIDPETGLAPYERVHYETGEIIEVMPEFPFMSLMPGLGHDWIMKYHADVYPADAVVMNGRQYPVPEYYDKVIAKNFPDLWEKTKEKRIEYLDQNPQLSRAERSRISDARESNRKSTSGKSYGDRPGPYHGQNEIRAEQKVGYGSVIPKLG